MNFQNQMSVYDLYLSNPWAWEAVNKKRVQDEVSFVNALLIHYEIGRRLLDLGCGTGHHASALSQKGYEVYGYDVNSDVIAIANSIHTLSPNLSFHVRDMKTLGGREEFDAVLCLQSVFSYNLSFDSIFKTLQGIYNSLIKGGLVVLDVIDIFELLCDGRFMSDRAFAFEGIQGTILLETKHQIDKTHQTMLTQRSWRIESETNVYHDETTSRLFFPQELKSYLIFSGFDVLDLPETLSHMSVSKDRLIIVGRK